MLEPPDSSPPSSQSLAEVERAVAALEAQREMLGDAVVDTALSPLRERLQVLRSAAGQEQRKLVTVLFADLEGFTGLSRRLDAEDTRDVVNACFSRWQRVIVEHGGTVEKYIGDAVMAIFGLHRSREDDAVNAVRAGKEMVRALAEVADATEQRHGMRLHMRVGIDTGEVVVSTLGEREGQEFVAVGPTVNRASRLQGEAPRDGVLISEETRRLVRGRFGLEPRPGLQLKGIDEPVDGYVVLAERPVGFDLEPAAGVGGVETITVGRDIELLALQKHLDDVVDEAAWRIVTVVGDPGVGKSRLLQEFDSWLTERPDSVWWFRGRASPSGQNRPHTLLRDAVGTRFGIAPTDSPAAVQARCEEGFAAAFGSATDVRRDARVVAHWLGFEVNEDESAGAVPRDPQRLRDEASELLARYLARLAETAPVVLLLEDLHWADDASLHWLDAAHGVLQGSRVLVVATARPAFLDQRPHWGEGLAHHERLAVGPLSRRESRMLLGQLLERVEEVPAALVDLVVEGAEGNPFFIEELVTWLVDSGVIVRGRDAWRVHDDRVGEVRVPTTLKGVLQARLDSLEPDERVVLQRASVVGRVFWDDAVGRLGERRSELPVGEVLDRLRSRELVLQRAGSAFEAAREYLFKHALLRDVTYEGMLRSHRRGYHAQVAEWLRDVTERHGRADEYAFLIAEHADRAGERSAASWYLRAGRRAASVYAADEAVRLLGRGLALATDDDPDLRFDLLVEHEAVSDRRGAREEQADDFELMAPLLDRISPDRRVRHDLARSRLAFDTSRYDEAVDWARRAASTAGELGLLEQSVEGRLWAGKALTWAGDGEAARTELEEALRVARDQGLGSLEGEALRYLGMLAGNASDYGRSLELLGRSREVFASAGDPEGEGTALVQLGTTYYHLGRLADARSSLEQARPIFVRSGYRYGEAVTLGNLATIAAGQGELGAALGWVREAIEVTRRLGDVEATATNLLVMAEIEGQLGRFQATAEHAGESAEQARTVANPGLLSNALATQASALARLGDHARARELVREARTVVDAGGSAHEIAVVELLEGHVLAAVGEPQRAREAYAEARRTLVELQVHGLAREARAGEACCLLATGAREEAIAVVDELLPHLDGGLEGAQPETVWLACWQVLRDAGDPRAGQVRDEVRERLRRRAELVGPTCAGEYLSTPHASAVLGDGSAQA